MLNPRLEHFFERNIFTKYQYNNTKCGKLSVYSTLFNNDVK